MLDVLSVNFVPIIFRTAVDLVTWTAAIDQSDYF